MSKTILIADDDPHILDVIGFALEKAGMHTLAAKDGAEALALFARSKAALIVLDINMPELDGLDVCREIRKTSDVPILFLSSRDDEVDRILGLELGGDDYVTKPFSPRELTARVKAILKRTQTKPEHNDSGARLSYHKVSLDPVRHEVQYDGTSLTLTATEFFILQVFLSQPHRVFDRDTIMTQAYDINIHVSDRTIDSHIRHIRQKFGRAGCDSLIETIHGVGYKLGDCGQGA